ncbi:recombinase family protein [Streptomyces misionensis]|uniref:recombinase family protein n=1 Tax=Streptomyces misionensis TaxID=67331 RepID=UPI0036A07C70
MTRTTETEAAATAAVRPDPCTALLYVCVDRGILSPELPAERAEEEGRAYAAVRGWRVAEVITDPYGEPDPQHREGWRRVRQLVQAGAAATVITRWPEAVAPSAAADLRHREVRWLQAHGVRVRYSWAPLAAQQDQQS